MRLGGARGAAILSVAAWVTLSAAAGCGLYETCDHATSRNRCEGNTSVACLEERFLPIPDALSRLPCKRQRCVVEGTDVACVDAPPTPCADDEDRRCANDGRAESECVPVGPDRRYWSSHDCAPGERCEGGSCAPP